MERIRIKGLRWFYWVLVSKNGRELAKSIHGYRTREKAMRAARRAIGYSPDEV